MSTTHDRRAPGAARMPFDAMVEVGGALGPSFEARALNLSEEGISLRTAYLPEIGQPVMCRFDAGHGATVIAAGEVLWRDDLGDGGEFGVRFTNLDAASTVALQRVLGVPEVGAGVGGAAPIRKVRLHIDGLSSPMRARIKDEAATGITTYSELGFLQMGKPLELEDTASGARRPALIDRVEVEVEEGSRIPQLVVSLRYDDADARAASLAGVAIPVDDPSAQTPHDPEHATAMAAKRHDEEDEDGLDEQPARPLAEAKLAPESAPDEDEQEPAEPNKLKLAIARGAAKVTPAISSLATRAKTAAALLAARARRGARTGEDVAIPVRRTTAPAPGGGLHAAGRKVIRRSDADDRSNEEAPPPQRRFEVMKRRIALGASIGIATLLAILALREPSAPQLAAAPPVDVTATPAELPAPVGEPATPTPDPLAAAAEQQTAKSGPSLRPGKPARPAPFTNGPVGAHANVLKIKMDGPVERILGASQPTGFTIVTPNRLAIDPAASLTSKDSRLEDVHVANDTGGAELTVTFKDGVPNYLVRARGDTLELVLAKPRGPSKAAASVKNTKTTKSTKKTTSSSSSSSSKSKKKP